MRESYFIFAFLISTYSYGQFNKDAQEIKRRNIKSLTFLNVKCIFDKEGRLIGYWEGDIEENTGENVIPSGDIMKYKVDSSGHFTEVVEVNYRNCKSVNCRPDTIYHKKLTLNGGDIDSACTWERIERIGTILAESHHIFYRRSIYGDTMVEMIYDSLYRYDRASNDSNLKVKFTLKLTPSQVLIKELTLPGFYFFTDSIIQFIDSTSYSGHTIFEYDLKGNLKKSYASDGFVYYNECKQYKDKGDSYSCVCKTVSGRRKLSMNKMVLLPLSEAMKFEQVNTFSSYPSSLLTSEYSPIIEYYE